MTWWRGLRRSNEVAGVSGDEPVREEDGDDWGTGVCAEASTAQPTQTSVMHPKVSVCNLCLFKKLNLRFPFARASQLTGIKKGPRKTTDTFPRSRGDPVTSHNES